MLIQTCCLGLFVVQSIFINLKVIWEMEKDLFLVKDILEKKIIFLKTFSQKKIVAFMETKWGIGIFLE